MSRQLKLTILLPGFYVGEDDTPEDVEVAMALDSENVIVVLCGHEGDSPGTVLRSLEGRIIDYGIRGSA